MNDKADGRLEELLLANLGNFLPHVAQLCLGLAAEDPEYNFAVDVFLKDHIAGRLIDELYMSDNLSLAGAEAN